MEAEQTIEGIPARVDHPRRRTTAYCIVLAILATVLMFWELGTDALFSDEALYALVVQNIKSTGQWLYVTPFAGTTYHQKPPLYFWLTASTYNLLGGQEFACRAWSAAAGVGAVVLTCVLGAKLFTPEVGAFSSLLLLLNRSFLMLHGARSGTFDALLTFLILAGVVVYTCGARRGLRWRDWIVIGVFAGLASMTKPLAGVPLVGLLAVHSALAARNSRLSLRLAGPAVSILVLLVIAGPWYVAQWWKFETFAPEMFKQNLVQRIARGLSDKQVRDWKFYLEQISKSSIPFLLAIPAVIYSLVATLSHQNRWQHALLLIVGAGWILLFSLSASKAVHYIYPVFPVLAIMVAGGLFQLAHAIGRHFTEGRRPRMAFMAAAAFLAAFSFQYARMLYYTIPGDRSPHVPTEMLKTLSPAVESKEARVVFCGFPELPEHWILTMNARDCYYLQQMQRRAVSVSDIPALLSVLDRRQPTLLVLSRQIEVEPLLSDDSLRHRTDQRFVYPHQSYVVLGVDLEPLLSTAVRVESDGTNAFRLTAKPPLMTDGRIYARLRISSAMPQVVRYLFVLVNNTTGERKTLDNQATISRNGVVDVSTLIQQSLWTGTTAHTITLRIQCEDRGTIATVESARLTLLPAVPTETHPRR
jgi:4-amino-4-deoxy-L-arabinose transferase-like glycosyltransferase